ncbi:hypothetical protein THAOC_01184, partial [Thalassiosira oceanica]
MPPSLPSEWYSVNGGSTSSLLLPPFSAAAPMPGRVVDHVRQRRQVLRPPQHHGARRDDGHEAVEGPEAEARRRDLLSGSDPPPYHVGDHVPHPLVFASVVRALERPEGVPPRPLQHPVGQRRVVPAAERVQPRYEAVWEHVEVRPPPAVPVEQSVAVPVVALLDHQERRHDDVLRYEAHPAPRQAGVSRERPPQDRVDAAAEAGEKVLAALRGVGVHDRRHGDDHGGRHREEALHVRNDRQCRFSIRRF